MKESLFVLAGVTAFMAIVMLVCGGIHGSYPIRTLQTTLLPLTTHEFWFPPCPFCWVVRGLVLAMLVVGIMSLMERSAVAS